MGRWAGTGPHQSTRGQLSYESEYSYSKDRNVNGIKPHGPVVACSIARWLKLLMAASGIDTSVYKAHSTQSASVSKAKSQGLSVDQILQRANWSQANTFYKFYDKKVQLDNAFQDAVLTSN